jgi:S-adenosylmethionine uptake transporter
VTLNYTSAIFLAIYLALAGMKLRTGILAALLLGLLGVALLLKPTLHADQLIGGLFGLGPGALAGMAYFSVRELGARGEPEMRTVFHFSLVASVCAALILSFSEVHALNLDSGLVLAGVAGFATLAQLAMTRAFTRGKTMLSAALAYSTVIFSSLFGAFFWGEVLDTVAWIAISLIILSGIAATHFSRASPVEQD